MKNEKENENEAYINLKSCGTNFDHRKKQHMRNVI